MQKHKPYQKIKQQRAYRKVLAVVSLSALICVSSVYFAFWYETKDAQAQVMFPKVEKPEVMKLYTAEQAKQRIIEIANERNFKWTLYLVKLATCESRFNQFENQPNYNPKQNKCIKSVDRGFFQINDCWHPETNDNNKPYDIDWSTNWTIDKINNGSQGLWSCDDLIKSGKYDWVTI